MPTRLLYLFLDMLGILSLKNKSITLCFLMTLLRLGALGQKWRTHCQKIWFFVVRIVYKPKTKCASAIGRNKPTASLTTTQLHWKTNPWSIDHTAVLVYAKCLFNTQEIQNNTVLFVAYLAARGDPWSTKQTLPMLKKTTTPNPPCDNNNKGKSVTQELIIQKVFGISFKYAI